jgi:hypothetical protein
MAAPTPDNLATDDEPDPHRLSVVSQQPVLDSALALHSDTTVHESTHKSRHKSSRSDPNTAALAEHKPTTALSPIAASPIAAEAAPAWSTDIRRDPTIQTMLAKMPAAVAERFDDEQLQHLRLVLGARQWGKHQIDIRGTFSLWHFRYYLVFVAGRNRRYGQRSGRFNRLLLALLLSILLTGVLVVLLVMLYVIKSALGIDLLPDYSLGLWHWLRS